MSVIEPTMVEEPKTWKRGVWSETDVTCEFCGNPIVECKGFYSPGTARRAHTACVEGRAVIAGLGDEPLAKSNGNFLVRMNCEYSIEVTANDSDEAIVEANKTDVKDWQQAWSVAEAEEC